MNPKTALITGASSGIGYETSLLLAQKGAHVFAVARREDRLRELAKKSPNITPVVLDVTGDLSKLDEILLKYKIDILVNNAGGAYGKELLAESTDSKTQQMIDTNLTALVHVTKKILQQMIKNKVGDIVNIGSIAAFEHYAGGAVYCAVKAAVNAITKSLRHEVLGKNIRVMGMHPGLVNTEFSLTRFDGDKEKADAVYAGLTPLTGKDIAEAIVWSLEAPRHMTIESMTIMPTEQASVWGIWREP